MPGDAVTPCFTHFIFIDFPIFLKDSNHASFLAIYVLTGTSIADKEDVVN
jgi:hypothetical protein